jgi:hypothetical protein
MEPATECSLHPAIEVRPSGIEGLGLFTREDIPAGVVVSRLGATSTDAAGFRMVCRCGSRLCRGMVTGRDWQRADLQERYRGHWVPALLERQRAAVKPPSTGRARPVR